MEFEMGDDKWQLAKGDALRPDAFPADTIERLRRDHRGSPFWLHYQQGLGQQNDDFQLDVTDFPFFDGRHDGLPVVISVDPALKTESTSQNVIHVYAVDGRRYILLQAFAKACTSKKLMRKVLYYILVYHASLVLVENTARGPDLIDRLRKRTTVKIKPINPRGTKTERLRACSSIIRARRVLVKDGREEPEKAVDQIAAFPNCPYYDHVDAMTNFLIWVMQQRRSIPAPPPAEPSRAYAALARGRPIRSPLPDVRGMVVTRYSQPTVVEPKAAFGSRSPYQASADPVFTVSGAPGGIVIKRIC
jgi:phage terminase large subunit-like protein